MTVFVKLNFSRHWIMVYRLWLRTKRNTTLRLSLSLSIVFFRAPPVDVYLEFATGTRVCIYIHILYIIRIRIYNIYVHSTDESRRCEPAFTLVSFSFQD